MEEATPLSDSDTDAIATANTLVVNPSAFSAGFAMTSRHTGRLPGVGSKALATIERGCGEI